MNNHKLALIVVITRKGVVVVFKGNHFLRNIPRVWKICRPKFIGSSKVLYYMFYDTCISKLKPK